MTGPLGDPRDPDPSGDVAWRPPSVSSGEPPEALAGYDGLVEVGRGGDSVVYRARELALSRDVAIKVLSVDDALRAERFAREIAITVDLGRRHPNIVNVLAIGTTASSRPAIVMDFYDLGSLADQLRNHGPLPVDEVVKIGTVLADALAFAHAEGVLHRDVKPQNVLRLPTSWVLADFGIARMAGSEHTASVETFTYRHASPQILDGYPPTASDDVWSLGSTLFTLVDGRPPFTSEDPEDDSALAYLRRARTEPHRRLEVPGAGALAVVVDRCLAKATADRYPSAEALRDALSALVVTAWAPNTRTRDGSSPDDSNDTIISARRSRLPRPAPEAPRVDDTAPRDRTPAPEPRSEPAHAPYPVALSVLAHAPAPAAQADLTGLGPAEPAPEARPAPSGDRPGGVPPETPLVLLDEDDRAARRRRRTVYALGLVALVVAAALTVGGGILRSGTSSDPAVTPTSSGGPVLGTPLQSLTSKPVESGPPQVQTADPKLAFLFKDLSIGLTSTTVEWEDPTGGKGTFALALTLPKGPYPGPWKFQVGRTTGRVNFPTAPGTRYCFVMTVILPDGDLGVSEGKPRCGTPH